MKKILLFAISLSVFSPYLMAQETTAQAGSAAQQNQYERYFATPRQAVYNFLYWLNNDRPEISAAAFRSNPSLSEDERKELARQLKRVLDARGLYLSLDAYPDEADYKDPLTEQQRVMLHKQVPQIMLQKYGTMWMFTPNSIKAIPGLYRETFNATVEYLVDQLPDFLKKRFLGVAPWQIVGLFLLILVGLFVRRITEFILMHFSQRLSKTTSTQWDEKILEVITRPLALFLMAGLWMLSYSNLQFSVQFNLYLRAILLVLMYFSVVWLVYRLVDILEFYLTGLTAATESKLDDQLVPLVRKTLKVFITIMGTIFVLQNLDIDVASLLTGLGIGGLAFALAARDTLANFFGSITIFLDKPFHVGDWIISNNIEGTVEEIGFRSTRIRTFYNSLVSVPNAKLADAAIDNMGMRRYRRIKTVLGLTYNTSAEQMQAFVEGVRAIVQANPKTRKDFYEIHFNDYGDFALNVLVYVFLDVKDWSEELRERHNILLEILRLAEEIGVEFAFPTQTLHVDSFYGDKPRQVGKKLSSEELAKTAAAFGPGGEKARPSGPVLTLNGKPLDFAPHPPAGVKSKGS